ncbi:DNA-directed RNA polymerase subunit delta [Sporosarcina cascadiensis]|uniref:DNA-directed RNA polymerase subunit delta n=1 Tax=Sporosarcina cascadiensis TaxID=2660747 RepID=UPI00189114D9|nr:DNA-directed RNA polymerase subunit delta [Sporosarcina cascadiensis]
MNIHEMTKEQLAEESFINITYQILTERRESLTLQQLMDEIQKLTGVSDKVMKDKLVQFYTDMNIDGRFLAIQDNRWGLREWYPVDQIEEETAPVVKVRKKKKKKKDYDDEDEEVEDDDEDEEIFDEEYVELGEEDDDDAEEDDDEEEVVEIEEDLIDPDDDLEVIPDEELDLDEEDEEEEEEDEEYEEEK